MKIKVFIWLDIQQPWFSIWLARFRASRASGQVLKTNPVYITSLPSRVMSLMCILFLPCNMYSISLRTMCILFLFAWCVYYFSPSDVYIISSQAMYILFLSKQCVYYFSCFVISGFVFQDVLHVFICYICLICSRLYYTHKLTNRWEYQFSSDLKSIYVMTDQ